MKTINRRLLIERLQSIQENAPQQKKSIFVIEVTNLNSIDIHYGVHVSSELQKKIFSVLREQVRESDDVYQLGNYRYVVVLSKIFNDNHCLLAINKILKAFESDLSVDGNAIRCELKIGFSIYPDHSQNPERLLHCAEAALKRAIDKKFRFHAYTKDLLKQYVADIDLENDLMNSIKNDELNMVYQPQVDVVTGEIVGMEALVRWNSAKHGKISPEIFIPIAENTGFIKPLSEWVVNTVMRQVRELLIERPLIDVSVNVSTPLLVDTGFVDFLIRALSLWGLPEKSVTVEVTESVLMKEPEFAQSMLQKLRDSGFKLSIDDFGTGYSSLSYLKQLPIDEIKIDKSFLLEFPVDNDNWKIVRTIVYLAKQFRLDIVAEGIETLEAYNLMRDLGVNRAQGIYISEPIGIESVLLMLNTKKTGLMH